MPDPKDYDIHESELEPEFMEHFVWVDTDERVFDGTAAVASNGPKKESAGDEGGEPDFNKYKTAFPEGRISGTAVKDGSLSYKAGKEFRRYSFEEICFWLRLTEQEKDFLAAMYAVRKDKLFPPCDVADMEAFLNQRETYYDNKSEIGELKESVRIFLQAEDAALEIKEQTLESEQRTEVYLTDAAEYIFSEGEPTFDLDHTPEEKLEQTLSFARLIEFLANFVTLNNDGEPSFLTAEEISENLFDKSVNSL